MSFNSLMVLVLTLSLAFVPSVVNSSLTVGTLTVGTFIVRTFTILGVFLPLDALVLSIFFCFLLLVLGVFNSTPTIDEQSSIVSLTSSSMTKSDVCNVFNVDPPIEDECLVPLLCTCAFTP